MVYLLPDLQYHDDNQFEPSEALSLELSAYFCGLLFVLATGAAIYNVYKYLY